MSPFPIHRAATAARMKAAPPSIRPKISAQNTTTLNRNRFNTIPDSKTRRDRLFHQQNGLLPRLPHLDASSLSTTRLHPSFSSLSSMSAIDPVPSISAITSSSSLSKHQLKQLFPIPGTDDIQKVPPPFTVLMLRYQGLSARNKNVRMEDRLHQMKHDGDRVNGNGNGKGDGNEEHADEENMEEDNREKED